jgi:hypothetical protein
VKATPLSHTATKQEAVTHPTNFVVKLCRWMTTDHERLAEFTQESEAYKKASNASCGPQVYATGVTSGVTRNLEEVSFGFVLMEHLPYDLEELDNAWSVIYYEKGLHTDSTRTGDMIRQPATMIKVCDDFNSLLKRLWNTCGFLHADMNWNNVRFRIEGEVVTPLLIDFGRIVQRSELEAQASTQKPTYRSLVDDHLGDSPSSLRTTLQAADSKLRNGRDIVHLKGREVEERACINAAVRFCHVHEGFSLHFDDKTYELKDTPIEEQLVKAEDFLHFQPAPSE